MSKLSLTLALALFFFRSYCFGALQYGFYDGKCGSSDVEDIVHGVINSWCNIDPTRSAALLRMQFHDCFVNGCDASILLNGSDLPPPFISVSDSIAAFAAKGLNVTDMVFLLGGHTVGVAHCSNFQDRLYNFNQTGGPDPTMDPLLLITLRLRCPQNSSVNNTANLDQGLLSSTVVDKSYYQQILLNKGILQIDQQLALDPSTKPRVTAVANSLDFKTRFGQAMVKLGGVQVLTGTDGEIRSSCRVRNSN